MLKIYNTLTRTKEKFQTLEPNKVKLYVCGVTVYNDAHVGHAMSALVFDIVRRYLENQNYLVNHVMNFTDVDDKIINRANELNENPIHLAERYIHDYRQNLLDLNVLPPTHTPRVTDSMSSIINMIQSLVDKNFAYVSVDNNVYFRVRKFENYGKLSGRTLINTRNKTDIDEEMKESPLDFALWKSAKLNEPSWISPWGKGRPGWHIECSAMNMEEFGEQIDIHGGGNDLIFPHHENEIAQTESLTEKPFARYWMHNGMLQLGKDKMSKSIGNVVSIHDFLSKHDSDVMRMIVLNGSYRSPLVFNDVTINAAEKGLERIKSVFMTSNKVSDNAISSKMLSGLMRQTDNTEKMFFESMDDDFNTARALGAVFDLVREINHARDYGANDEQLSPSKSILLKLTNIFGLRLTLNTNKHPDYSSEFIELLMDVRNHARQQKIWEISDMIRNRLEDFGIKIDDEKNESKWRYL